MSTQTETETLPAWWVSWYSPGKYGGFELHWPWWRTGWMYDENDEEVTIFVAAIRAESEDAAYELIAQAYDEPPTFTDEDKRFCNSLEGKDKMPWEHEGTRFPFGDWMTWA